ncbi:MAG: ATP-binding cassette domain-containing protein [Ignavibacteriaceae bacterium]|nr:ATP-binding cassette domain-containing protein [Ignavibacteriaceae bacterium]
MRHFLEVKNIKKYFKEKTGTKQLVFENLSFNITENDQVVAILIPFGGGKTTLQKILSGLDDDYSGEVLLNGKKNFNKLPYIPGEPTSYPWHNVTENVKLIASMYEKKDKISSIQLQEFIDIVGLTGYENHFPFNKSYGFRFRISLARALVISPQIILLDDSFKQMDFETKVEIFELIEKIKVERKIKFLLATSNITEVALLSDKILLMKNKPGNISGEIIADKNKRSVEQIKNEILKNIQKEDILNCSNFSI